MALKLTVHFNCSTKVAYVKDDSTYSLPASVKKYVLGSLNYPNGLSVFTPKNTILDPLINYNASPRVSANFTLGSTIPAGNYTFSGKNAYEYINTGTNQSLLVTANNAFSILNANLTEALYVGGTITLAECAAPANDGTYTITSVDYNSIANSTAITVSVNTLQVDSDEDAVISFSSEVVIDSNVVYNYSTCASTLCPEISFTYDAFSTQYGNATLSDTTNYYGWSNITKTLSLYYPAGLSPAPATNPLVVNNASNIAVNELATGIYTCKLVTTGSYVQNDGLVIDVTATKIKQATVIAYTEMCGIQGCITKMLDRHVSYLKSATVSPLQQYVDQVYGLYINAKEALACGDKSTYSNYVSQIYTILGTNEDSCGTCSCGGSCDSCSDSCGCGQPDEPVWIDNLGINVDSLLAQFEEFITETWPIYQDIIDSLNTQVNDVIIPQLDALETTVSSIGTQTNTNTGDITTLTSDVTTLQNDVVTINSDIQTIQDEIATLTPVNSEIVLNELFTNDGDNPLNYFGLIGTRSSSTVYIIEIFGNYTSSFSNGETITFYSAANTSWFEAPISSVTYNGGTLRTIITLTSTSLQGWSNNSGGVYFFKANPNTGTYLFKKQFTLSNTSFWKYGDSSNKYWSKLKTSFFYNGSVNSLFRIYNQTTNEYLTMKKINPGSIVDLELTMEKKFNSTTSTYDTVFLFDAKINTSISLDTSSGQTVNDGCSGYIPYSTVDLYQNNSIATDFDMSNLSVTNRSGFLSPTQEAATTNGQTNISRFTYRFASGPSYPNQSVAGQQFFSGGVDNIIVFNNENINIVLLNFEVSYGKMPA